MVSMKARLIPIFLLFILGCLSSEEPLAINAARQSLLADLCEQIMQEAYERAGHPFILTREYGFDTLQAANEGRVDGELYRIAGIEEAYTNLVPVPVSLIEMKAVIFTKGLTFPVAGPESLLPYRVGIMQGVVYMDRLTAGLVQEKVHRAPGEDQLLQLLDSGRVDAIISDQDTASLIIRQKALSGISPLAPPLAVFPIHHYLHKRHSALIPGLTAALTDMEEEGRLEELREEFRQGMAGFLSP